MTLRKIDAMHKYYGKLDGEKCGDCCNFYERKYNNKYFKCSVYGMSNSTATDWTKKWVACGHFNIPFEPDNHRALFYNEPEKIVMEEQLTIDDLCDIIVLKDKEF